MPHILTRRSFLSTAGRTAVGVGLASLMNIPPFLKRALAEGNIGINGKKLIFIFLRGGNDGINNVAPVLDPSYRGTADAIYQNMNLSEKANPDLVCIFGADHIYRMNIRDMIEFHVTKAAEVSIAAIPVDKQ